MIDYNKKDGINYIHDYINRIERTLEKLRVMNSFNSNKIIEFYKELKINGISEATQTKYLDRLMTISTWVNKDFDKLTREELINLIEENLTKRKDYSDSTKRTFRIIIKRFFQWLKGYSNREYPIEISWMRSGSNNSRKHKNPEDMLNDEDIEKMVNAVSHPRNKAFIMTLAESGCRIGELLTLTKKKICFDEKGAFFLVDGKTGTRRVRVVNATPFLHAWLNVHPNKNEDDAPLWTNIGTTKNINNNFEDKNNINNYKMQWSYCMSYAAVRKLLQVATKKAGILKPCNPHNFRHSRATKLCSLGISGNILNEYFGWTQASRSVSTYLHLSGKQVDDTLLNKAYGMTTEISNPQPKMFPTKCFSCGQLNEHDVSRCIKCNSIIGQVSNNELEEQKTISQILKLFGGMVDNNSDLKTQFVESIKKEIMSEIKLSYQKEKNK
jgi:integrase/recombinase XerD